MLAQADPGVPHLPNCSTAVVDGLPLAAIRDVMTELPPDPAVKKAIMSITEKWRADSRSIEPITEIRRVLDGIRAMPRGNDRLRAMNTLVRTLGQREMLATLLDMMRDAANRTGSQDEELTRPSRQATKHALYGWAGQTLLIPSGGQPTEGTLEPEEGVRELLGDTPPLAMWGLSLHLWQPNHSAKGFASGARIAPDAIVEPPHSHPFDFASMVSVGTMRQSIYVQKACDPGTSRPVGRYDGVRLEHVDGVWPEHTYRLTCELSTLEAGVELSAGQSYYLPCDMIHDVEFNTEIAATTPAVSLFLASEIVVKPHVYIAATLADAHDAEPRMKDQGRPLSESAWHEKLRVIAAYLRGQQPTLSLKDIVKHDSSYAFFHVS